MDPDLIIPYHIDNTVDRDFAKKVLRKNTFECVYGLKQVIRTCYTASPDDLTELKRHPQHADLSVYLRYINRQRHFKTLRSDQRVLAREIAITYQLYHPSVIYTYYEDYLWKVDFTFLKKLMEYVGSPLGDTLTEKLAQCGYESVITRNDIIKFLLDIANVRNSLPSYYCSTLMQKLRDKNAPTDWYRLSDSLTLKDYI